MKLSELLEGLEDFLGGKLDLLTECDPSVSFFVKDTKSGLVRCIDLDKLELSSEVQVSMKRGDLAVPDINTEICAIFSGNLDK